MSGEVAGDRSLKAPAPNTGLPAASLRAPIRPEEGRREAGGHLHTPRNDRPLQARDREPSAGHSRSHARPSAHTRMRPNTARLRGLGLCGAFSHPGGPSPPTSPTTGAAYSSGRSCCWLAAAASRGPRPHLKAALPEGSRGQSIARAAA